MRVRTVLAAAGIAAGTVLSSATAAQAWTAPVPPVAAVANDVVPANQPHVAERHRPAEHEASRSASRHHRAARHHHHRPARHDRPAGHRERRHHPDRANHHAGHRAGHHGYGHPSGHHAGHEHLTRRQKIRRVLAVARAQRGKPYRWGAAGPHAFDCSGFVQWVYRRALGRQLPKYTDTQYAATRHVHYRRKLRRGDLVFVRVGRHEEHVGIYAGHWHWWVAPHTGSHIKYQHIYPARHVYSRVIH